jgi:hypothetical protein
MRRIGPIEITSGRRVGSGSEFDVKVSGHSVTIRVEVDDDRLSAHVTEHEGDLAAGPLGLAVSFLASPDGGYSGSLTLPRPADLGWVAHSPRIDHIHLAAGGDVSSWLSQAGATVEGATVSCTDSAAAVAVVATAATRVRPTATGYDLGCSGTLSRYGIEVVRLRRAWERPSPRRR